MPQLNIIIILCILCVSWLILRRLDAYTVSARIIIISLLGVLFLRPLIGEGFFLYPAIIFENIILIAAFSLLIIRLRDCESKLVFSLEDRIFLLFILMLIISLSRSINLHASINQLIYFISIYLLYWSIKNLPNDKRILDLFLKAFIVCGLMLIIYAVHQYTIGFSQMREFLKNNPEYIIGSQEFAKRVKQNLIFATFIYPPAFGDYLSMMFLTLLGITYLRQEGTNQTGNTRLFKYIPLLIAFSIIPLLILTKSKGAWVSLFSGIIFFHSLNRNSHKSALKPLYTVGLFIFCFLSISLFSRTALPGIKHFFTSFAIRLEYWKAAMMMIKEHPLLGFGPGTFGIAYPLFKTKLAEETIMAHNSFLQFWAESGFLALSCFVLFICLIFIKAFKNRARLKPVELGLLAAFLSFLIQNLFDFGLFDSQRSTIAFGLLGLYSLGRSQQSSCIVITCKKTKATIRIICAILLSIIIFYSINIYLGRHFDSKAGQALKTGDMNRAVNLSTQALRHNPLAAEYFYHRAYIFEQIARQDPKLRDKASGKAISNYLSALKLNPFAAYYHLRLGTLLFISRQKEYEQSTLFHFKKAVQMYPVNPVYHEQLAEFYDIMGNQDAKKIELKQAEELKKYFKKGTR